MAFGKSYCNRKGQRPKISEDVPKLFTNLIIRCWDVKAENRPTANELFEKKSLKTDQIKINPKTMQTHPQAIYTSRLLNFKSLPKLNIINFN
ncbi:hypothetical protein RclHR1_02100018 [Rhizophagus clarus]|uniref:Serine-threonine/tyrosine-protein kinase catalytic domain-containing protein n=1 Tax=Rhizophagus clarus TaxID=94130 RepID=A0A2Z6R507_9GLOM|nr:hypothetical protein RclHR1_02100018 [Rhizophagus clarus]